MSEAEASVPGDFIRSLVALDVASGKHGGRVVTRFPPEDCAKLEEMLTVVSRELMPEVPLPSAFRNNFV